MCAAGRSDGLAGASATYSPATGLDRALELTAHFATSWLGLVTAYVGAVTAAIVAFQKLNDPLRGWPIWARVVLVSTPPAAAFVCHTIPALVERRRRRRLSEITGSLRPGYFSLAPRENQASFTRADGKHDEVLEWLGQRSGPVLYLTGLSGSGKSSLLSAWVLPNIARQNCRVALLRGYQDPLAAIERELRKPGMIWQRNSPESGDVESLVPAACRHIRPHRLLMVLDQFEEFLILQAPERQERFKKLILSLCHDPVDNLAFLLVLRNEYIGLVEAMSLPPLLQDTNWKEIPPFTESAARDFMRGSDLHVSDELLRDVLREAAEIEQTKGLIRPITINLCGLVIGRFAAGLPRGFRPGGLIRGFLRESLFLPPVREIAPKLVPHLITNSVTKRPRTVSELAGEIGVEPAAVRGCLRVLGQSDRAIVRPLDAEQETWEISHDFLIPLLDSIVARWSVSFWRRVRCWLPWIAAAFLAVFAVVNVRRDPVTELAGMGWQVQRSERNLSLSLDITPPQQSVKALKRIRANLHVRLGMIENLSEWGTLQSLCELDVHGTKVSNLEPLKGLKNLSNLNVAGTQIVNLEPLGNLKSLSVLNLSQTQVRNVEPLKSLPGLSRLDLSDTQISSIEPLRDLTNLSILNLIGTKVGDLEPLRNLKNLSALYLGSTPITNLEPLGGLPSLYRLGLRNTQITNLGPLRGLPNLARLNLSATRVSNLGPISGLPALSSLDLSDTPVSDVQSLRGLSNLVELHLAGTKVTDVSPLTGLKKLATLGLDRTQMNKASIAALKHANSNLEIKERVGQN